MIKYRLQNSICCRKI